MQAGLPCPIGRHALELSWPADRGPCAPRPGRPPRGGFPPARVLSACRLRAGCLGSEGLQQVSGPYGLAACSLHDRQEAGGWRRMAFRVSAMDEEQPAGAGRPGAPHSMMAQWACWQASGGAHAGALRPGHSEAVGWRSGASSAATTASRAAPHSWHPLLLLLPCCRQDGARPQEAPEALGESRVTKQGFLPPPPPPVTCARLSAPQTPSTCLALCRMRPSTGCLISWAASL